MAQLTSNGPLKGALSSPGCLTGKLSVPQSSGIDPEGIYSGSYEVTTDCFEEQVLETANKLLSSNIIVHPVPYSETGNLSNGVTVNIGG